MGVRWMTAEKSWMNQDLFIKWIDYEFPFVAPDSILLVFDSAHSHISTKVKSHLHTRRILFAVIPGGLTSWLQPCDVSWFKPLKVAIAESIDGWKANGPHSVTSHGNVRPPTTEQISSWLCDAWNRLGSEAIASSFTSCFLGDGLYLHIARNQTYGSLFRIRLAELTGRDLQVSQQGDLGNESDINEIDDE
jgi:hypothetical protein